MDTTLPETPDTHERLCSDSVKAVKQWPWEGAVQNVFADVLLQHGWEIESLANTATKARGVDMLARKADRSLGAEVKGYPSVGYEDPARAGETKRSSPSGQARNWYAKGVLAALMLREAQPERASLLVLPDAPRYRDLLTATRTGLTAAEVHVVLLRRDGLIDCESWRP